MSDEKKYEVPSALPVAWHSGERSDNPSATSESAIVSGPMVDEMAHVLTTQRVCGQCKYFSVARGQALMKAQRFLERLVREDHWQVKHLASPVNDLGVCGAHTSGASGEEEMLTGRMHKACDQYRSNEGNVISISRRSTDRR